MEGCWKLFGASWSWWRHQSKTNVPQQLLMLLPIDWDTKCNPQTLDRKVFASNLSATEGEDERRTQTIFQELAISSLILGVKKHETVTKRNTRLDMAGSILLHSIEIRTNLINAVKVAVANEQLNKCHLSWNCEAWHITRMPPFASCNINWILFHNLNSQNPRASPPSISNCSMWLTAIGSLGHDASSVRGSRLAAFPSRIWQYQWWTAWHTEHRAAYAACQVFLSSKDIRSTPSSPRHNDKQTSTKSSWWFMAYQESA